MRALWTVFVALSSVASVACSAPTSSTKSQRAALEPSALDIPIEYNVSQSHPLAHVRRWEYVISNQTASGKLQRLAESDADLVVIDEARMERDQQGYDMARDVRTLHGTTGAAGRKKVVLAYANVGQAETNRYYFDRSWVPGSPDWIVARDPDGWGDTCLTVAYWRSEWHDLLYRTADSVISRIARDGFDGVYMDWVEAASAAPVVAQAAADGVDPKAEMVRLIQGLRDRARQINPNFMIVAQNGVEMRDTPGYLGLLSGQAQEQIFFDGLANMTGDDARQGDCRLPLLSGTAPPDTNADYCSSLNTMRASSEDYIRGLSGYLRAGVPVFSVNYALDPGNVRLAYEQDARFKLVGLVTRRSLDDVTTTRP